MSQEDAVLAVVPAAVRKLAAVARPSNAARTAAAMLICRSLSARETRPPVTGAAIQRPMMIHL